MRISDWSSDVCSSDLPRWLLAGRLSLGRLRLGRRLPDRLLQRRLALESAEVIHHAGKAVGLARLADVAAVQDEPVVGVQLGLGRSEEHTSELQSLMRI